MASFRNSNVPDWAANENNGYFRSRRSGGEKHYGNQNIIGDPDPGSNAGRKYELCLPKDQVTATSALKNKRVSFAVRDLYFLQVVSFVFLFATVPVDVSEKDALKDLGFIKKIAFYCTATVFCIPGLLFMFTLYLTMYMFGILLTSSNKYGINLQDQINRCTSWRFFLKPIILALFINVDYLYYFGMFDNKYRNVLRSKSSAAECWYPSEKCFFLEENLVLRISVTMAALHFYFSNFLNGLFILEFSCIPVNRRLSSLIELSEATKYTKISILIAVTTGLVCFVAGPLIYCSIFFPFGIVMWENGFIERLFLFLNFGFIIRMFLYTWITCTILPFLLKLVNHYLTTRTHLHVEASTGHQQCLLLSEAMKSDSTYLKYLAFNEYNFKGENEGPAVSVFFKITHPGNHPHNWRNVFNASAEVVTTMNDSIVNFFKTNKMPPNFLESGLGPYVINQLRDHHTDNHQKNISTFPVEVPRVGNMRDLTSSNRPDFPHQIPTITEAIRQNLELLWNDARAAVLKFFSMDNVNTLIFAGKLDATMYENVIANLLTDYLVPYWAIMGTVKLMCVSIKIDSRGVVNQDIKPFLIKILETYDVMTALEVYIAKSLDDQPGVNKKISDGNKVIASKLANTCIYVLARLHYTFRSCYPILGVEADLEKRILDVIGYRDA